VGVGERFAQPEQVRPTSRIWRGRSSLTRELPKCARSTRGVLSVAAKGVASSVQDVNRYTAADSGSPRRRSVGHASHSRQPISRRGSGDFRSAASAPIRTCPVGGPGDTRRLGELELGVHTPTGANPRRARPCSPPTQKAVPRRSLFLWYSPSARR